MAEWSIAAVLKTVELRGSGGSNPSLSADKRGLSRLNQSLKPLFILLSTQKSTQNGDHPPNPVGKENLSFMKFIDAANPVQKGF